jgi:hypothetical protein
VSAGFAYFRKAGERYLPATARAALKALGSDLLPPEPFLFLGTSVRPLDEEPVTLEEIERVLARNDLDVETNLLLMRVFRRLLTSTDPEVTLFAAESINRIEGRYTDRIELLKRRWKGRRDKGALRDLAATLYHLAQLYPPAIRSFYLREAFDCIKQLRAHRGLTGGDVRLLVRILLDLGLSGQALGVLKQLKREGDPAILLLEAEVEFQRRNLPRVRELCLQLQAGRASAGADASGADALGEETRRALDLWTGA